MQKKKKKCRKHCSRDHFIAKKRKEKTFCSKKKKKKANIAELKQLHNHTIFMVEKTILVHSAAMLNILIEHSYVILWSFHLQLVEWKVTTADDFISLAFITKSWHWGLKSSFSNYVMPLNKMIKWHFIISHLWPTATKKPQHHVILSIPFWCILQCHETKGTKDTFNSYVMPLYCTVKCYLHLRITELRSYKCP